MSCKNKNNNSNKNNSTYLLKVQIKYSSFYISRKHICVHLPIIFWGHLQLNTGVLTRVYGNQSNVHDLKNQRVQVPPITHDHRGKS